MPHVTARMSSRAPSTGPFDVLGRCLAPSISGTSISHTGGAGKEEDQRALLSISPAHDVLVSFTITALSPWVYLSLFAEAPGPGTAGISPDVYSVASDATICLGDGKWRGGPLPRMPAGTTVQARFTRSAGRLEVSLNGGDWVVVIDGITRAISDIGIYLCGSGTAISNVSVGATSLAGATARAYESCVFCGGRR